MRTSFTFNESDEIIYCRRCGAIAGEPSLDEDPVDDRLPTGCAFALIDEVTRAHDVGDQRHHDRQQQRAGCEPEDDASSKPERSHVVACSRYPSPRTVTSSCGCDGSFSSLTRNRRTVTSTSRSSPDVWYPHTRSRSCGRLSICPR